MPTTEPKRDARYLRQKAEQARRIANSMTVPGGRDALLEIAEDYKRMETLNEAKEKASKDTGQR